MRYAVATLGVSALVLFACSLVAQQPDEDARRQRFFEALRNGARDGEGIGIVPVPGIAAQGPNGVDSDEARKALMKAVQEAVAQVAEQAAQAPIARFEGDGEGIGIVRIEEAEAAPHRTLQFEATILHVASSEDFTAEEQAVSGETADDLIAKWSANGKIKRTSTFRLTSLDNQEGFVTIGEQAPVTTGRTFGPFGSGRGGPGQSSVTYQDFGAKFAVRGKIDGSRIEIECNVEESRLEPTVAVPVQTPSADAVEDVTSPPANLDLPSLQTVNVETVVTVPDGGKVVLSAGFHKTEKGSEATIITLKASILP